MVDTLSAERRSWNMSRIRGRDTGPERLLRSLLHREGFRFRLHDRSLPGKPDIVMRKHSAVIMVQGCYWHRHPGCRNATTPSTRTDFWVEKFEGTIARDRQNLADLTALGWRVITIWECDLRKRPDQVMSDISSRLREA